MFVIDRIENNIVTIEELETEKIKNVDINFFDKNIIEGSIFDFKNNFYWYNEDETKKRIEFIKNLTKNLWN